jgi:hypothetical protein
MSELKAEDFFGIYDGALSAEFCRNTIERFEKDPRKIKGLVGEGNYRPEFKGTTEIDFNEIPEGWQDVVSTVSQNLKHHLRLYMERWGKAFKSVDITHEGFRMSRYDPGEIFNWHSDNIGSAISRVITAMWYLNTVEEGGETEYQWNGRAVKPVEGRMALIPVGWTYYHRSAPPVTNAKYIIITQLHQKRRMVQA